MFVFRNPLAKALAIVCPIALTALTGCGIGVQQLAGGSTTAVASAELPGRTINGHVHGGAFPIQNAKITLMETQNNGYGGQALVLEQVSSNSQGYFTFDNNWTCTSGQYAYIVVAGGNTISGASTSNNNVIQVGIIGSCAQYLSTTTEQNDVNVFLSEPSTVAAAYALANFITIDDHKVTTTTGTGWNKQTTTTDYGEVAEISAPANNNSATPGCSGTGTGMTCKAAGLAHGFMNAYNLVDSVRYDGSFPTGLARTTVPGNSETVVPQAMINTLGNILQSCVDSNGVTTQSKISSTSSDGTSCGNLFEYTTPPGGTSPTTTLQAAINIAANPNNNVDTLFKLQPTYTFFTPALTTDVISGSSNLMSFSISIFYEGTGLSGDTGIGTPVHLALDGQDNVYMLYTGGSGSSTYSAIDGLTAGGSGLFVGAHVVGIANPNEIAIDNVGSKVGANWVPANNAWVTDDEASGNLYQFPISYSTSGSVSTPTGISTPTTFTIANGYAGGVAIDLSNNVWVVRDSADNNLSFFNFLYSTSGYTANALPTPTPVLSANTKRIFIDQKQNLFGVTASSSNNSEMYVYPYGNDGSTSTLYTSQSMGLSGGFSIVMNSSDEAYIPLDYELQTANATQSGNTVNWYFASNSDGDYTTTAGTTTAFGNPGDVALDGAGNIFWTDYETTGRLFRMVPNSSGSVSNGNGTLTAVYPCFPLNNQCFGTNTNLRGLAIDSSGAIWYVADSSPGLIVQTLGFAETSWPLISYAEGGTMVK